MNKTAPKLVTTAEVRAEFEKLLIDRTDMGIRNLLGDVFLEPRNPFERQRRKAKKWVAVVAVLLFLALVIVYAFHLR